MKTSTLWVGGIGASVATMFVLVALRHDAVDAESSPENDDIIVLSDSADSISALPVGSEETLVDESSTPTIDLDLDSGNTNDESDSDDSVSEAERAAVQQVLRQSATREVLLQYSQLFRHLGIDGDLEKTLANFLIDEQVNDSFVDREDIRASQLEEILGAELLEKFLELEGNTSSYAQVARIGELFTQRGVPLSESQADLLFESHVDVLTNYESDVVEGVMPALELVVLEMDGKMRLITERAPAFLSPGQVVELAAYNDDLTRRRLQSLDQQVRQTGDPPVLFPFE